MQAGNGIYHYENTPMQYTAIFHGCKNDNFQMKNCDTFLIFAQNIEAVLTSTHNLCFRAKMLKKNEYPCKPQFYYIKVGCKGVYITRTCYPDECSFTSEQLQTPKPFTVDRITRKLSVRVPSAHRSALFLFQRLCFFPNAKYSRNGSDGRKIQKRH